MENGDLQSYLQTPRLAKLAVAACESPDNEVDGRGTVAPAQVQNYTPHCKTGKRSAKIPVGSIVARVSNLGLSRLYIEGQTRT